MEPKSWLKVDIVFILPVRLDLEYICMLAGNLFYVYSILSVKLEMKPKRRLETSIMLMLSIQLEMEPISWLETSVMFMLSVQLEMEPKVG